jgi:hypothetical protein
MILNILFCIIKTLLLLTAFPQKEDHTHKQSGRNEEYHFWEVRPRGSCKNRCFRGMYQLYHQGDKNWRARKNFSSNLQLKHAVKKYKVCEMWDVCGIQAWGWRRGFVKRVSVMRECVWFGGALNGQTTTRGGGISSLRGRELTVSRARIKDIVGTA